MLTQSGEDAWKLVQELIKLPERTFHGKELLQYLDGDHERIHAAIDLLVDSGSIEMIYPHAAVQGLPEWAWGMYTVHSRARTVLKELQLGRDPFTLTPSVHHGDQYHLHAPHNRGAVAQGPQATANYQTSGQRTEEISELLRQMGELVAGLPQAERDDGEYQITKLAAATEQGPEAVQSRLTSFLGYLESAKGALAQVGGLGERASGYIVMYHIAIALFSHYGAHLPPLPLGL